MVEIHDKEQNNFIAKLIRNTTFLGLREKVPREPTRQFTWCHTNSTFSIHSANVYQNWYDDEPNNGGPHSSEECVEIYKDFQHEKCNGKWNDVNCNEKRGKLCMKLISYDFEDFEERLTSIETNFADFNTSQQKLTQDVQLLETNVTNGDKKWEDRVKENDSKIRLIDQKISQAKSDFNQTNESLTQYLGALVTDLKTQSAGRIQALEINNRDRFSIMESNLTTQRLQLQDMENHQSRLVSKNDFDKALEDVQGSNQRKNEERNEQIVVHLNTINDRMHQMQKEINQKVQVISKNLTEEFLEASSQIQNLSNTLDTLANDFKVALSTRDIADNKTSGDLQQIGARLENHEKSFKVQMDEIQRMIETTVLAGQNEKIQEEMAGFQKNLTRFSDHVDTLKHALRKTAEEVKSSVHNTFLKEIDEMKKKHASMIQDKKVDNGPNTKDNSRLDELLNSTKKELLDMINNLNETTARDLQKQSDDAVKRMDQSSAENQTNNFLESKTANMVITGLAVFAVGMLLPVLIGLIVVCKRVNKIRADFMTERTKDHLVKYNVRKEEIIGMQ